MRVLFDHQIFTLQKYGGISRYYFHLMDQLQKIHLAEVRLGVKYSDNAYLQNCSWHKLSALDPKPLEYSRFLHGLNFRGKGKLFRLANKLRNSDDPYAANKTEMIRLLKEGDFDIFQPTYHHDLYFLDYLKKKKLVWMVPDMTHEIFPEYFPLNDPVYGNKKILAERADLIITISENSRRDFLKYYNVDEDKVKVTYLASNLTLPSKLPINLPVLPAKYLLFTGVRGVYKNFYFMLIALVQVLKKHPDVQLVCLGGGDFTSEEKHLIHTFELTERIVSIPRFTDEVQAYVYSKALAFIFPSIYEGFGIPILEAWNCDCPVVLSGSSCFPEIGENGATYFDAKDAGSLVKAVEKVISDENLRMSLVATGRKLRNKYSLEKVARETAALYLQLSNI